MNETQTGTLSSHVEEVTGQSCHCQLWSDRALQPSVTVTVNVIEKPALE